MKKLLGLIFAVLLVFFARTGTVISADEFRTDITINYDVQEDGQTQVTHNITLTNRYTDFYATSYSLTLTNIDPSDVNAFQSGNSLPMELHKIDDKRYEIKIAFPDAVVGEGSQRKFSVKYIDNSIAQRTGEVWEVSIPKLSNPDEFGYYAARFSVPNSFGELAYVSPSPQSQENTSDRTILNFDKTTVSQNNVVAAFGKFQVFSFSLAYHLENPLNQKSSIEIAVPPDTAYQKVLLENMAPAPLTINVDDDGNWLAYYILEPRQKVDVIAQGSVLIYPERREFPIPSTKTLTMNLQPTDVWQSDNEQIKTLAQSLKTPKAIYDYVVNNLEYDFERVKPNVVRLGALTALNNPKNAICMEFTDLFIALARAAGIPSREVNGYAYTEDPENEPLSLVDDVLHAWPEYWDSEKKVWVPIDPTWGNTTGGIDFFNKLDLRHFAFVMHGNDSYQPYAPGSYKLGPEPIKDIDVQFGSLPLDRNPKPILSVLSSNSPLFADMTVDFEVRNQGVASLGPTQVQIYFDDSLIQTKTIDYLPPYAAQKIEVKVPFSLVGNKMPATISATMGDQVMNISTNKETIVILNLSVILGAIFLILLLALVRIRRVKIFYAFTKFRKNITRKIFSKRSS